MPDHAENVSRLIGETRWAGWRRVPLAGDASSRRYERLIDPEGGASVILMDAGPGQSDSLAAFVAIARHLAGIGLCPPALHHVDIVNGLLIISDLGPDHMAQWLTRYPDAAPELYTAAVDIILHIQSHQPPGGLPTLDATTAAEMLVPFRDWFAPDMPSQSFVAMQHEIATLWALAEADGMALSLRDYHAENLIWRPQESGLARVGLLDFQDALIAPLLYDLASLLRDARRDVTPDLRVHVIRHYCDRTGSAMDRVETSIAILSVQRNLRILGIFAQLAHHENKPRYLALIPRILRQVDEDLHHPVMAGLRLNAKIGLAAGETKP